MSSACLNESYIEDQLDPLFARCGKDALIKSSSGMIIGLLSSSLLPKRKWFPVWLGFGFGLGFAYTSCNMELRSLTSAKDLEIPYDF